MTEPLQRGSGRPWIVWRKAAGLLALASIAAVNLQAKELPRRKADEPKTADAACAYLGEGYTRAPGSDTCVKVSGRVRAEGAEIWGR